MLASLSINIHQNLLFFFCVLSLGAISGMFSEKVGIVNIGINGMMSMGCVIYLVVAQVLTSSLGTEGASHSFWQLLALPIAGIGGMLFASLHGFATIKLKSDHTISGFAINLLAFGLAIILLDIFGNGNKKPAMNIQELAYIVNFSAGRFEVFSLKIFVTLLIIVLSAIMLYMTKWGLRFRSVGENPQASDVAGINVNSYKWQGVLISGFIAGIAGGFFAQARPSSFNGDVLGYGYLALSIMIMGQWNIYIISAITFLFSGLYAFAFSAPSFIPGLSQYQALFTLIPYVSALAVIALTARKSHAPAASGITYDKSKR
ncbi:ABC transporter permease [Mycoplasma struthionis]|uniref:ABC transporter permease n=1 Tax=Mycoplasma struthionis TaxID=538220 RepID=A0A502M2P9_9MOLU|nr:ABC transporter permease [Mycoplasma struthionis]TPI02518.1 ABC transporter permease [Mycoplasma struthionis]